MPRDQRRMTFVVVPHGGGGEGLSTRSFEISYRRLRVVAGLLVFAALLCVGMVVSWLYVAAQAARVPGLVEEVEQLEQEREGVAELAEALDRLERQYEQMRTLLGADEGPEQARIWLPPVGIRGDRAPADTLQASLPTSWPLTQPGFVTREHLGRVPGQHPGIDIAVPEGAYVRAAGSGMVVEAAEDEIYGKYVRIRHRDGYESMYAHASQLFVASNDRVERHEVIALSGNTGTSTAPHLHFEILKDGEPVDPRTMVQAP